MSDRQTELAIAFLQSQPNSAAGVLEQQPIEKVALFLSTIPYSHAAAALKNMLPHYIAKICHHIEPTIAAAFMSEMDVSLVVAVMRDSDPKKSNLILEQLPEKTKLLCKLLLNYGEDSVGAWMISNLTVIPVECNVEEARKRFSMSDNIKDTGIIYIVNRERMLVGLLSVNTLFNAAPTSAIASLMNTKFDIISGRTPIKTAIEHTAWEKYDTLAVCNRNQQFVGVIRHVNLRQSLKEKPIEIVNVHIDKDPISEIYQVYGKCLLALLNTFSEAINFKKT